MTDHHLALQMLDVLAPGSNDMWFAAIDGAPSGNLRALLVSRGGCDVPLNSRDAVKGRLRRMFPSPIAGNLALGCVFFRPNRQRVDVDNMMKHVSDAANGIAWHDDAQVTSLMGRVELDVKHPRTVVMIARHESSLERPIGGSRECDECHGLFVVKSSKPKRLCSRACQIESQRKRNRAGRKLEWVDCACGEKTSKPGVVRCRKCWLSRMVPGAVIKITTFNGGIF